MTYMNTKNCEDCGKSLKGRHGLAIVCLDCREVRQKESMRANYRRRRALERTPEPVHLMKLNRADEASFWGFAAIVSIGLFIFALTLL